MRIALLLSCSLLSLAGCGEKVIGSAVDMAGPDGGPVAPEVEAQLARYAIQIGGIWEGPPGSGIEIEFIPSTDRPRSGTARVRPYREFYCLLIPCTFDLDAGPQSPSRFSDLEYWVVKPEGAGALVILPDPSEQWPISLNGVYVPSSSPPRLEFGLNGGFVLVRQDDAAVTAR